mgnify:CR=1 FL=1
MKKLLVLIFALLSLVACTTVKLPIPVSSSGFIDYLPLTSRGIYVTESNSVSFDYEAIGSIYVTENGGWVRTSKDKNIKEEKRKKHLNVEDDSYYTPENSEISSGKSTYISPDVVIAMENMAQELKKTGANGIINLKIEYTREGVLNIEKITISGMAIKK